MSSTVTLDMLRKLYEERREAVKEFNSFFARTFPQNTDEGLAYSVGHRKAEIRSVSAAIALEKGIDAFLKDNPGFDPQSLIPKGDPSQPVF